MRKVRFRVLLPLLMTAARLLLFGISLLHQQRDQHRADHSEVHRNVVLQQQGGTIDFKPMGLWWHPNSLEYNFGLALNFPAMYLGGFIGRLLIGGSEVRTFAASIPFVPLVWYMIGGWIDRLLSPGNPMPIQRLVSRVEQLTMRGICTLLLLSTLLAFTTLGLELDAPLFPFAVLCGWCAGYLVCSIWGERVLRKRSRLALATES